MARMPYPDSSLQSAEVLDRLKRIGSLNVTRMMSHAEGAMINYSRLGGSLLFKGTLDPVLRELVILRVGQLCGSDYEWHQHVSVARTVGMDEATLHAITEKNFAELGAEQQCALKFAEEIKRDSGASAKTFTEAQRYFSPEQLTELCLVTGYYIMTAGFLRSFDIEIEDGPPLGESIKAARAADR
jgi:alkylhydroperoxidase family enzyme